MTGLLGLLCGLAVVILGSMSDGDPLSSLFSLTALIIVVGGTFAALLTQFGLRPILIALKGVAWLVKPPRTDLPKFIEQVAEWSSLARSQGTLELENVLDQITDPFQKKGLQMVIDNTSPENLHPVMAVLANHTVRMERTPGDVWEAAGGYSPTIGVMGAVLGLIHVMMRLNHPEELGVGIATAFVATIYGVGGANLFFLPLGNRLAHLAEELERERHVVIQGFVLLAEGKPGIFIRQNLQSFLDQEGKPKRKAEETEDVPGGVSEQAA
jgi:chemotaxis protein MotA